MSRVVPAPTVRTRPGAYPGRVPSTPTTSPDPRSAGTVADLARLLAGRRTLALTGAGLSTESGIPDYRSPERLARPSNPMRYQAFVGSAGAQQRYWARSFRGWQNVGGARPNAGHRALASLERSGLVGGVLTQNVDGLHQRSGSKAVLELHGNLRVVRCLGCGALEPRSSVQTRMSELNPATTGFWKEVAHDGAAEIPQSLIEAFRVPGCTVCGGVLKPDVVFFGENVPPARLLLAWAMLERADALLVLGSSLTVYSGYRFVERAVREGKPVAIVNLGPTRGDAVATLKLEGRLGTVLPLLEELLR